MKKPYCPHGSEVAGCLTNCNNNQLTTLPYSQMEVSLTIPFLIIYYLVEVNIFFQLFTFSSRIKTRFFHFLVVAYLSSKVIFYYIYVWTFIIPLIDFLCFINTLIIGLEYLIIWIIYDIQYLLFCELVLISLPNILPFQKNTYA